DDAPDRGRPGSGGRFTVSVTDRGSAAAARKEQAGGTGEIVARATVAPSGEDTGRNVLDEEALTIGVGLALLAVRVADFAVLDAPGGAGTEVKMSWPVGTVPVGTVPGGSAGTGARPEPTHRTAATPGAAHEVGRRRRRVGERPIE